MSPICSIVRSSIDDYLNDALAAPQRGMFRDHLAACEECRDTAAAQEPMLLFARPIRDEMTEADRQQILSAVRTGVGLMETERRIGQRSRRRLIGPAAAAAVAALVLLAPGWGVRKAPRTESNAAASLPAGLLAPPNAPSPAPLGLRSAGLTEGSPRPASGATIYDWSPGTGREEPRVVWIVDGGLDI